MPPSPILPFESSSASTLLDFIQPHQRCAPIVILHQFLLSIYTHLYIYTKFWVAVVEAFKNWRDADATTADRPVITMAWEFRGFWWCGIAQIIQKRWSSSSSLSLSNEKLMKRVSCLVTAVSESYRKSLLDVENRPRKKRATTRGLYYCYYSI